VMMTYNPPYYKDFLEEYGFFKEKDLLAYEIIIDEKFKNFTERLLRRLKPIAERARRDGFTIRNVNLRNFKEEAERIMEVYNSAWEKNWGFVPMTRNEFMKLASDLKRIVIPELAKIVERDKEPVAFGLIIPDVNEILRKLNGKLFPFGIFKFIFGFKKIEGLRLLALGVKKKYRKRGVDSLLYYELLRSGLALKQFKRCELSWLLEDNYLIIRASEFMGGKLYKRYRIYGISI